MNEGHYKTKVARELRKMGFWVYCPRELISKGVPDIISLSNNGKMMAIELKLAMDNNPNPTPTALQQSQLAKIAKRGGIAVAMVIDVTHSSKKEPCPRYFYNGTNIFTIWCTPRQISSTVTTELKSLIYGGSR